MWHSSLSQASYEPFSLLTRRANKVVRTYCTKRTEDYYSIRKLTLSMNTGSFFYTMDNEFRRLFQLPFVQNP
jgi:hypothetical protein